MTKVTVELTIINALFFITVTGFSMKYVSKSYDEDEEVVLLFLI